MESWWIPLMGTAAAVCTTGSFVPQVIKIWRERDTAAISKRTYLTLTIAAVVWTVYGWLIGRWP
jgi:MtN3 and saliva related transmembrane protein